MAQQAMRRIFINPYKGIVEFLSLPIVLGEFFTKATGKEYGVGLFSKIALLWKMKRNNKRIPSKSSFREHLIMATKILNVPKSVDGCVVECGCFKGASTTNLSLVCAVTGRQLHVFDSFQGLPDPEDGEQVHHCPSGELLAVYSKGDSSGTLKEVKANIRKYGRIDSCVFNPGYFEDSLPSFKKKCVLVFLDVDLISSLSTCVRHLWPLLHDNCYLFTHEARDEEYGRFFFDRRWWSENLGCRDPGLVGAGCGLGLIPTRRAYISDIGYAIKRQSLYDRGNSNNGATGAA